MARILEHVTENFKYTSLKEFNAILRLYRVEAYQGPEKSQLYQHRGLLYRALDEHGKYIGVPLKASFFNCKPTLDNLEKKFVLHQSQKQEAQQNTLTWIRWHLHGTCDNLERLDYDLAQDDISMVLKKDKAGNCKEVAYVDFKNKCVVLGESLMNEGGPASIQQVIDRQKELEQQQSRELGHGHRLRLHW